MEKSDDQKYLDELDAGGSPEPDVPAVDLSDPHAGEHEQHIATEDTEGEPLFEPIFGKVVVRVENANLRRTRSGLYVPDKGVSRRTYGEVIAVYPKTIMPSGEEIDPQVKVGDKVLFGEYSGTEVRLSGTDYIVIREQDILSIVFFDHTEIEDDSRRVPDRPSNLLPGGHH